MRGRRLPGADVPRRRLPVRGGRAEILQRRRRAGRVPFTVTHRALPGLPDDDAQARYIEVEADGITVIGIYLPNGNSGGEAGFAYKLAWMDRLAERAAALLEADTPFVITGDFNVAPTDDDFAPGALSPGDALVRPESRARFRRLLWLGLTDAVRALHPNGRGLHVLGLPGRRLAARFRTAHRPRPAVAQRWPSGWWPPRRTARNAAPTSRRITCRC